MKIKVSIDDTHRFTMGMHFNLVDEMGTRIENATFIDWHGTKVMDNQEHSYLIICIPSNDLFIDKHD